jgi:hypothetical protein
MLDLFVSGVTPSQQSSEQQRGGGGGGGGLAAAAQRIYDQLNCCWGLQELPACCGSRVQLCASHQTPVVRHRAANDCVRWLVAVSLATACKAAARAVCSTIFEGQLQPVGVVAGL